MSALPAATSLRPVRGRLRELGSRGNEQREAPGQGGASEGDDHSEHDEEADDPHESNSLARGDHYLGFGEHRRRER